jgi:hypothetical protein
MELSDVLDADLAGDGAICSFEQMVGRVPHGRKNNQGLFINVHFYDIDYMPDSLSICQRAAAKFHDDHLQLLLKQGFEQAILQFLAQYDKQQT